MKRILFLAILGVALVLPPLAQGSARWLSHERAVRAVEKVTVGSVACKRIGLVRFYCTNRAQVYVFEDGEEVPVGDMLCRHQVVQYQRIRVKTTDCLLPPEILL